ncbi:hypothetical protein PM082_009448 [Marasmius tenuissimus]|nr:hypothetical protein PM082_009448 [Marasmius tenuissimus]
MTMNARVVASSFGLGLTALDVALCWQDERRLLWNSSGTRLTRILHVSSRSFTAASQILDVAISISWKYKYRHHTIPVNICYYRWLFEAAVAFVVFNLLNVVFMLRELTLQTLTFGLTIMRAWRLEDAWISAPTLGWVLKRDAYMVFMAITGALTSVVVVAYTNRASAKVFLFPAVISVASIATCRAIIHLLKLTEQEDNPRSESGGFIFSTYDSAWETQTNLADVSIPVSPRGHSVAHKPSSMSRLVHKDSTSTE